MAYRIRLPSRLAAIHDVFHISQLKKCVRVPEEIVEQQDLEIESDLSYVEHPMKSSTLRKEAPEEQRLKCTRSNGTITLRKKLPGKQNTIFNKTFLTSLERI